MMLFASLFVMKRMMAEDGSKATLPLAEHAEHGDLEDGTESAISRVRSHTLLDGTADQAEKTARASDIKLVVSGEASEIVRDGSGIKSEALGAPATSGYQASGTAPIAPASGIAPITPAAMPPSTPAGIQRESPRLAPNRYSGTYSTGAGYLHGPEM